MRRLPAVAAAVAALTTVGVGAGSAFAAGTPASPAPAAGAQSRLQKIQAKASAAVTHQVDALNKQIAKVQAAKDLGADQAPLLASLQGEVSGLQALGRTIAADTTAASAAKDAKTIVTGYRVKGFELPMSRMVLAADRVSAQAVPRLTGIETKLAARVTPADTAQVTSLLADMKTQLTSAGGATAGLAAKLLVLTPAGFAADHALLAQPRASLAAAGADLKKAVADAKLARADIKAAGHSAAPAPAPGA
ncbi:hypothetical protein K6U06_02540 [Acidiferrimicrobium sp. IK]|uniref:hypothetical protein n=1 Tax=Acidiferrimicrobium sp. IK TaxID=2871700 RepID=UPI0021CB494C|nr:hypothetical protein [Acidiferrimicrobium sp. IK]MCU4183223.1 hypothetical protein [Acidiferrimicrobium sp. IK]